MRKIKLSAKLLVTFLAVGVIPASVIGLLALNKSSNGLKKQALASLQAVGNSRVSDITHLIQLRHEQAKELAETLAVRQMDSSGVNSQETIDEIQLHIESVLAEMKLQARSGYENIDKQRAIASIGVWDTEGTIVANTNKDIIGNKMSGKFLQGARTKGSYFGGFEKDPLTGENFLIILQAIRDYEDVNPSPLSRQKY